VRVGGRGRDCCNRKKGKKFAKQEGERIMIYKRRHRRH